jgi:hypothetical protein
MKQKTEHSVKVKTDCCCGQGWCKFFFEKKDKETTATSQVEAPKKTK